MEKKIYIRRKACKQFDRYMRTYPNPIIIYDTETTGKNPYKAKAIQLSAIKLVRRKDNGQYAIDSYLNQYIRPDIPVEPEASAVNHITNEFLADKPSEAELFPQIRDFFRDVETGNAIAMGYCNTKFDDVILKLMYNRYVGLSAIFPTVSFDVKDMVNEMVSKKDIPDGRLTLQNIAQLYGAKNVDFHNSMGDIIATGDIAFRIYEDYIDNVVPRMPDYQSRPKIRITNMYPFKKSKTVDFVMITGSLFLPNGQVLIGNIRYDKWNKWYTEEEGSLFEYGDMDQFDIDANIRAGGDINKFQRF